MAIFLKLFNIDTCDDMVILSKLALTKDRNALYIYYYDEHSVFVSILLFIIQ